MCTLAAAAYISISQLWALYTLAPLFTWLNRPERSASVRGGRHRSIVKAKKREENNRFLARSFLLLGISHALGARYCCLPKKKKKKPHHLFFSFSLFFLIHFSLLIIDRYVGRLLNYTRAHTQEKKAKSFYDATRAHALFGKPYIQRERLLYSLSGQTAAAAALCAFLLSTV